VLQLFCSVLHEFLNANRARLIDRCRDMVASRSHPKLARPERAHGIPVFLDQLIKTLKIEQRSNFAPHPIALYEADGGLNPNVVPMAALHGRDLLQEGFTIEQVIRDYGDVCQAVTQLAAEAGVSISAKEFHTFNRCLDDAIAAAVTEYSQQNSQIAFTHTETALSAALLDVHEAQWRAMHDSLTGLPNRELFDNRLAQAIALADRHDWTLAVMFLDLDQFKNINDALGHTAGDAALRAIAQRLMHYVRDEDTVCRNGGDEFLYLLMTRGGKRILCKLLIPCCAPLLNRSPSPARNLPSSRALASPSIPTTARAAAS
jgi:GGDEF domain-containing protein